MRKLQSGIPERRGVLFVSIISTFNSNTSSWRGNGERGRENINADGKTMRQMIMDNNSHNDDEDEGTVK